jgi:hypothetical protein
MPRRETRTAGAVMSEIFASLDREPRAVTSGTWTRRALLLLLTVVVVVALLNAFGQRPAETGARVPAATIRLSAPERIRGGLLFQSRLDIRAVRDIQHPRVVLDDGWVEGMQVNSITPQPVGETTRDGRLVLSYDTLSAGDSLRIWFQFQVNPTNVGHRSYAVELDDAEHPVVRLARSITALP